MDLNDKIWNPWHGCHKCSEGCQNCYAYFMDKRYGRDTNEVVRNKSDLIYQLKRTEQVIGNCPVAPLSVSVWPATSFWKKRIPGALRLGR